jgi:hypothetical protein
VLLGMGDHIGGTMRVIVIGRGEKRRHYPYLRLAPGFSKMRPPVCTGTGRRKFVAAQ